MPFAANATNDGLGDSLKEDVQEFDGIDSYFWKNVCLCRSGEKQQQLCVGNEIVLRRYELQSTEGTEKVWAP